MGSRLKFFREPFTKEGLKKLEVDLNRFLSLSGGHILSQSYTIVPSYGNDDGAWMMFVLQYPHDEKKNLDPDSWWTPKDDAAAQKSKDSDASKPGPDLPSLY